MKIRIITPAPPRSRKGNRITALRWARMLRRLGHRVLVEQCYRQGTCDLLIALHAVRSAAAIAEFRADHPQTPLLVALTGTDLYEQLAGSPSGQRALQWADRLIVLQSAAVEALAQPLRDKTRVIYQSMPKPLHRRSPIRHAFEVCVLAHLRAVKDPLRAAKAARRLPATSRIRIVHLGAALDERLRRQSLAEQKANARYCWLGDQPHWKALQRLARSRLLVLSSKLEGGANVVSEAIAAGVPILSTRIPGSVGILGADYPGYFPVGDTDALAELLDRAERDEVLYGALKQRGAQLAPLVDPAEERRRWKSLLQELSLREERRT